MAAEVEPTYRRLRRDETDAAVRVQRRGMATVPCFDETLYTAEEDRAFYRERVFPECEITGAFAGDALLGHVAWRRGWIEHFFVDPDHQGGGIGTRLLALVQARLDDIQLWTFQTNAGARRFYERHGFVAEEIGYGPDDEEGELGVRYRWRRVRPPREVET